MILLIRFVNFINTKMKIIPGIMARTKKEFDRQLKAVSWAKKIHIDIADGSFVKGKTVFTHIPRKAQLHLMVQTPFLYLKKFPKSEVIIHAEAGNAINSLRRAKHNNQKIGLALNPETNIPLNLLMLADFVLIMTIKPGKSGRKMIYSTLKKIKLIKKFRRIPVGVDGGINAKTVKAVEKAGADFAISTSFVTLSENPKKSLRMLKNQLYSKFI